MCGITGVLNFDGQPVSYSKLSEMTALLSHRGPDGQGVFVSGNIGLGHRRLSIIDISNAAKQPMVNANETIIISFNGEIYNFRELTKTLVSKGYQFITKSDTEVIIKAYEEWGKDCLNYFNGMFAIAIYDKQKKSLFLARDRLGIKPLFYYHDANAFIFASEIKAILAHPSVSRNISSTCLHNYLSLNYSTAPLTLFDNVYQILPGHSLEILNSGKTISTQYWNVSFLEQPDSFSVNSESYWMDMLDEQLSNAVKRCLVSDVPFGAFLSGGLDSSTVTCYMTELLKSSIKTFSMGFNETEFSELPSAKIVSEYLGTEHTSAIASIIPDEDFLKKIVWHSEEPTADSSFLPMFYLSKMTKNNVSVALSGDGADEILAGYSTYSAHYILKMFKLLPEKIKKNIIAPLVNRLPVSRGKVSFEYKLKQFIAGSDLKWDEAHYYWRSIFDENTKRNIYTELARNNIGNYSTFDFIRPYFDDTRGSCLNAMLEVDTKFYLPNDMLVKVDRASMANSLEVRVPFLDHELVEVVARMPPRLKLKHYHKTKYILKKLMSTKLPRKIIHRKKEGFNVPISRWISGDMKELTFDVLSPAKLKQTGIFDSVKITKMLNEHISGKKDHGYRIWGLLILQTWSDTFDVCYK